MKKLLSFFAAIGLLIACTPEENGGNEGGDETVHVTGISLDHSSATIKEGETVTLVATVTPDNAENKIISWSTSSDAVATVDNSGKVTGIKAGSTTITATTEDGGKKATCALTVEANLAPSVTVGADHVSAISAVLMGKANLGSTVASDLKVGFQYSTSAGILPSNSTTVDAEDADADYNYTTGITGLEPSTTYYFRGFVRQNGQDTYGETKEFTTKELSSLLHTQEASAVSAVSAKVTASLDLTDVLYKEKAIGFYWGDSPESVTNKVTATGVEEEISSDLTKLTPSKQYYYQAYITFDGKELKEGILSFTTKDLETLLETRDASDIEATKASLNAKLDLADVKYASMEFGFYWGTSEESQNNKVEGKDIAENAYASSLTGLSHKTQYWFKAYVKLDSQTFYGDVKTFTTDVVPVESVSLDKTQYTFNTIGNTLALKATVLPEDATDKSVEWSSDNEEVATVDASGIVKAVGNGKATITVTTKDQGKTASCAVTVAQYVTGISLDKTSLSLAEGEFYSLIPTISPDSANDKSLTWTSSNESVATVDQSGKVTAVSKGTATIKATANDGSGKYASCSITVKRLVSSITLDKTSITVYNGKTETITASVSPSTANDKSVTWTSSNTSVATVSSSGVVTGKTRGNATITVTANDGSGVTATCEVEVKQYVTEISLDKTSLSLAEGENYTLAAAITPDNANDRSLTWTSSDQAIAKVDQNGKVTAVSASCDAISITATANDGSGVSASCSVCVLGTIDLGLSVKWANYNLGASSPEEYGDYYAWGETETKSDYSWSTYKFGTSSSGPFSKYVTDSSHGTVDNKTVLDPEDDVAHVKLGGSWRMPTEEEVKDLINTDNCTWEWTTMNGVNGYKVTSKKTGYTDKWIFLSAAGYRYGTGLFNAGSFGRYWSSSLSAVYPSRAYYLGFGSSVPASRDYVSRFVGLSVRPVSE